MNTKPVQECPRCQTKHLTNTDVRPSFCLQCRFPLIAIAGKYHLTHILSQNNQSTIYLATHCQLKRKAERVIKVLSTEALPSDRAIKRFYREVQVTSELSQLNKHIIRIYDDFGDIPYFGYFYVMEYLQGNSLQEYIATLDAPPPDLWSLQIIMQICDALQTAHENHVIHRDIKPQNIMLLPEKEGEPFVKVLNWGIAKTTEEGHLTAPLTQYAIGTPLYMSPEQIFNETIDVRTDIYSIGILLFELLTGTNPFAAKIDASQARTSEYTAQVINAQIYQNPPKLSQFASKEQNLQINGTLESIVQKAMAKNPNDRYQSITELKQAVLEASNSLPSFAKTIIQPIKVTPTTKFDTPIRPYSVPDSVVSDTSTEERTPSRTYQEEQPKRDTLFFLEEAFPSSRISYRWLSLFVIAGLLLGAFLWWLQATPQEPSQGTTKIGYGTHRIQHNTKKTINKTKPARPTKAASNQIKNPAKPIPKSPEQPKQRQEKQVVQLPPKPQKKKRRKITKKRVRKYTKRRVQHKKKKTKLSSPNKCVSPSVWVDVHPYLSRKSEVIAEGGKAFLRSGKGLCLSPTTHRLSIMQRGHALCIFKIKRNGNKLLHVKLKSESDLQTPNYCIR